MLVFVYDCDKGDDWLALVVKGDVGIVRYGDVDIVGYGCWQC